MSDERTMVERVARAIVREQSGTLFREECTSAQLDAFGYVRAARAAIEAMKDPPLDVLGAMHKAMFEEKWDCTQAPMIGAGWDAGIDAALKEGWGMTPEQKKWLDEHPNYSPVHERMISLTRWTDKGWLFHNGRFVPDGGQTLFPHKYPSWFGRSKEPSPMEVGRHYEIV